MKNKIALIALGYVAIGSVVAVWSVKRHEDGKKSFAAKEGQSNSLTLAKCIGLWPLAVYTNLSR